MAKSVPVNVKLFVSLRESKGLSQESLAALAGVSRSAIASYESGDETANIGLKSFNGLATAFGTSYEGLLALVGSQQDGSAGADGSSSKGFIRLHQMTDADLEGYMIKLQAEKRRRDQLKQAARKAGQKGTGAK